MKRSDFQFDLPPELIAQEPPATRGDSRLLVLDGVAGTYSDSHFSMLSDLLRAGDLLVLNDTRVLPARLLGRKASGGRVEVLVERVLDEHRLLAHVRANRAPRTGTTLVLARGLAATVRARHDDLFELVFTSATPVVELLERHGRVPLPPYIDRPVTAEDSDRYQTVYARHPGAVAAPTAGLHFTPELLAKLREHGVEQAFVTLHVGAGTFQPVRVEQLAEHHMHAERLEVGESVCHAIRVVRERGSRVVAAGTTVVRALEAACASGEPLPFNGDTDIFIYPGYRFRCVDALITNFHLPESTLLMLVSAFAGYQTVIAAYRHAVASRYRFFSYGDAMFMTRKPQVDVCGRQD